MSNQAYQKKMKSLQWIYVAFIVNLLIVLGFCYYLDFGLDEDLNEIFKLVIPASSLLLIILSHYIPREIIKKAKSKELDTKYNRYFSANILKWMLLEIAALLNAMALGLTDDKLYLFISAAIIALMVMQKPDHKKMAHELELSEEEINKISNT